MTDSSTWTLTARYVAALATVAALSLAGQALVQTLLTTHEDDSRVINIAGRQRMLSQRIVKSALILSDAPHQKQRAEELRALTDEWARVHHGLRHGDVARGLPGHNSALVESIFQRIDVSFEAMLAAVRTLASHPADSHAAIDSLLAHEAVFLEGMDRIVSIYERESRARVLTLQRVEMGLLALVLVTLLLEGLFVFRPAVRRLRDTLASLRRSESEKSAILKAIPDTLMRVDSDAVIREAYQSAADSSSRLFGLALDDILDRQQAGRYREHLRRAIEAGEDTRFEYQEQHGTTTRYLEARLVPCGEDEALVIIRDLSERRRLERELLDIAEREQARIGQDLHDGLCQHLAGLAFMARSMTNQTEQGKEVSQQSLSSLAELLQQGLVLARQMSRGLFPAVLVERGLGAALKELAKMTSTLHKVSCTCEVALGDHGVEQSAAFQLYRIAQEALTNAVRHGKASNIVLSVDVADGQLTLRIVDDGIGMPGHGRPTSTGGMGLRSMETRSRMIDAQLEILPAEPSGTIVQCRVPVSRTSAVS